MGLFKTKQEKLDLRAFDACRNSNYARLFRALEDGANPNFGANDSSLLYRATWHRFQKGVELLLARGADPNFKRSDGHTALHEAASDGSFEIAKALIAKGADVNAMRSDNHWRPLHHAANNGRSDVARLLIASGADTGAAEEHMNTPADLADKNHPRLADMIRGKKVDDVKVTAEGTEGWHLTAVDEVSSISQKSAIGYRLTEIFNFGAGIYTRIARNLETGAESQSTRFFDEFNNRAAIDAAKAALLELGGQVGVDASAALDKPVLRPRGLSHGDGI